MWWKDPDLPRKGHQLHWVEVGHRVPTCRERRRRSFAIHREHRRFDSILDCGRIGQRHLLRRRWTRRHPFHCGCLDRRLG